MTIFIFIHKWEITNITMTGYYLKIRNTYFYIPLVGMSIMLVSSI